MLPSLTVPMALVSKVDETPKLRYGGEAAFYNVEGSSVSCEGRILGLCGAVLKDAREKNGLRIVLNTRLHEN